MITGAAPEGPIRLSVLAAVISLFGTMDCGWWSQRTTSDWRWSIFVNDGKRS